MSRAAPVTSAAVPALVRRRHRDAAAVGRCRRLRQRRGAAAADVYRASILRELSEEDDIDGGWGDRVIGLINDDRAPVGQVHLGVVHLVELAQPRLCSEAKVAEPCVYYQRQQHEAAPQGSRGQQERICGARQHRR